MTPVLLALALSPAAVEVIPGSVQKVSQVTGERDRQRNTPTDNQTETRFGLWGTDLGASFEHDGKLVFLFGDTLPSGPRTADRPADGDAVAFSRDRDPSDGLTLDFVTAVDGKYLAPQIPGVSLKAFEVPTGGFSRGGWIYAYFTTDSKATPVGHVMGRSVLAKSRDGKAWRFVHSLSTDKLINVSPSIVDAARVKGLPFRRGKALLLFASGREYRRSDPFLACVPLDRAEDRAAVRYWAGEEKWSRDESKAAPLFRHPQIGELSVAWCAPLGRWLMLYNSGAPRGIVMRTAERPAGPWSKATVLFDPWRDGGYGKFIHASWERERLDEVHDPNREREWGGEYGPYLISRFFRGGKGRATIHFLMSTWNPYQVVLMRASLQSRP